MPALTCSLLVPLRDCVGWQKRRAWCLLMKTQKYPSHPEENGGERGHGGGQGVSLTHIHLLNCW